MLKRISNVFYHTLYHLSAVGFGALVALLFIQIVTRNLLKFTSSSIDEFTKFLFVPFPVGTIPLFYTIISEIVNLLY